MLCDLRTGKPYPGDPKEKIVYTPTAKAAAAQKGEAVDFRWQPTDLSDDADDDQNTSASRKAKATTPAKPTEPNCERQDTSFNFGHNVADPAPRIPVSQYSPFPSGFNPFSRD
jgi:hypothetical protein